MDDKDAHNADKLELPSVVKDIGLDKIKYLLNLYPIDFICI